jgi:hypothetical protein
VLSAVIEWTLWSFSTPEELRRLYPCGGLGATGFWPNKQDKHQRLETHSGLVRKELALFLIFFHQRLEKAVASNE